MTTHLKRLVRAGVPGPIYDWLAGRYGTIRRLYEYPATANLRRRDYDTYWQEKADGRLGTLSAWRRRRAEVFARLLQPGDRVLDVGTGDGAILTHLVATRQIVAKGLDISRAAVDFCRSRGLDVDLVDLTTPATALPDGVWDYAILSEIIEHLPAPEELLDALRPRVGRALLISIPNTGYITHRLRLALGRFPLQWVVSPGEHLRFWTVADFAWWARALGFRLAARHPYEGVRGLRRLWPSLFAAGLVYVLVDDGPPAAGPAGRAR